MTVEIVNPEPDPSVAKHVVCKNCGVKLSYLPVDLIERKHTDYGGGTEVRYCIDCPKCKKEIVIRGHY